MELYQNLSPSQFAEFISGKQVDDTTINFDTCDVVFTDGSAVQIYSGFESLYYIITSFSHD
ncbi:hypothetical protein [Mucilaginibacter flavus]|uniref:hypothetical protein n=1 Tax=Mucilaginibacter flavus TaxID=931504 RepID=UPI0025B5C89D|nr:hypothetical protein [Mucilaginibacter flavus]